MQQVRHDDEIDDERPEPEEHRRRPEIGPEGVALVLVEARRHEGVDLREDHGARQECGGEEGHLDLREEIFLRRRVDHPRLRHIKKNVGDDEQVVDVLGEEEADDEHHDERDQRADEARAQLDQMIHERRFRRLDVGVGHRRWHTLASRPGPTCRSRAHLRVMRLESLQVFRRVRPDA